MAGPAAFARGHCFHGAGRVIMGRRQSHREQAAHLGVKLRAANCDLAPLTELSGAAERSPFSSQSRCQAQYPIGPLAQAEFTSAGHP